MAKVIVVTSGKGGVGKTTSSAAIAAGMAMKGYKTVAIDFDVGLRNLEQRLHLLFAGEASLETGRPEPGTFECRLTLPFPVLREAAE